MAAWATTPLDVGTCVRETAPTRTGKNSAVPPRRVRAGRATTGIGTDDTSDVMCLNFGA